MWWRRDTASSPKTFCSNYRFASFQHDSTSSLILLGSANQKCCSQSFYLYNFTCFFWFGDWSHIIPFHKAIIDRSDSIEEESLTFTLSFSSIFSCRASILDLYDTPWIPHQTSYKPFLHSLKLTGRLGNRPKAKGKLIGETCRNYNYEKPPFFCRRYIFKPSVASFREGKKFIPADLSILTSSACIIFSPEMSDNSSPRPILGKDSRLKSRNT